MSATAPVQLGGYIDRLATLETVRRSGVVSDVVGLLVESHGPAASVGEFCEIETSRGRRARVQVIGFRQGRVLSMPLEELEGVTLGDTIVARGHCAAAAVGPGLLGRVFDGFGEPIDGRPAPPADSYRSIYRTPPGPLERENITEPLVTGIRAIDTLLPCGRGQRVGIFGGSGVGKSTLLGAMARGSNAQINVIALIGERNREVRSFLENELGPEGLERSVVIVSTSDQPAPLRVRACFLALAVAEYFRDRGDDVLLVMDSVTRLAMAQREIGLNAGEPPSQKGYTPSVFGLLPKIFERAGNFRAGGSITGFFTVLVEGDDFNEPVCDAVRGILDGHIILSRQLGAAGHYPAIDVLRSVSRVAGQVATPQQLEAARKIREALASFERAEDLINLGAYVSGANAQLDSAVRSRTQLLDYLKQDAAKPAPIEKSLEQMHAVAALL